MRHRTVLLMIFAVGLVAILGLAGGGGWFYSGVLKDGALVVKHVPTEHDLEVVAIGDDRVTLGVTDQTKDDGPWTKDGIWGLEWAAGYAREGAILEINEQQVTREIVPVEGDLGIGDAVHLDGFSSTGDPRAGQGLAFTDVVFPSPLVELPGWFLEGSSRTWVVFVHGKDEPARYSTSKVHVDFACSGCIATSNLRAPVGPYQDTGSTSITC